MLTQFKMKHIWLMISVAYMSGYNARMFNGRPVRGKVGAPKVREGIRLPDEQFYEFQKVNHFDGSDFRYWKQRYFVNNATFRSGGPIFLMLGGESEASGAWLVDGAWQEYARDHGAFLVLLEHRYYGESHPVPDIRTPNLQYLSSRQALADTAQFINYFKSLYIYQYLQNSSVILFGGSYGGSLAAWTRSRYPYLVDGAVASSAPMVAMMEFQDYYVGVGEALDTHGSKCKDEIRNATTRMYDWWGQIKKRILMQKIFRLCDKINHDALLDLSVFFYNLAENFAGVVQYNNDNREFLGKKGTNLTIQTVCDIMTDESRGDSIQRYADVNSLILDTYSEQCLNLRYDKLAYSLNHTSWGSISAEGDSGCIKHVLSLGGFKVPGHKSNLSVSGFFFHGNLCNSVFVPPHYGWSQVTDNCDETNRFYGGLQLPISSAVFVNGNIDPWRRAGILEKPRGSDDVEIILIDVFSRQKYSEVADNCDETNRFYGGMSLPISKAVFVNGMMDPWRKVSLSEKSSSISEDVEIILIDGTAHCADMYPPASNDPSQLTEARSRISNIIGNWIAKN